MSITADTWLGHGLRVGDYVVERGQRLDHAMRIDRIIWSTWADVTHVATGWKEAQVALTDLEKVAARLDADDDDVCHECGKSLTEAEKERDRCARCGHPYHDELEAP